MSLIRLQSCIRQPRAFASAFVSVRSKNRAKQRKKSEVSGNGQSVRRIQTNLFFCVRLLNDLCVSGGDEPREAQLGAPQRGPPRPDHSGGHTQPCQDQTPASHQRGQETSRARCESQRRSTWTLICDIIGKLCV